jgi:hypothetical protein
MHEDREALYQRKGVDAPQCYQMRGGSADAVQTQLIGSPENDAMPQLILLMQRGDVGDWWILNEVHEGSTVYQVQRRDPLPHVMKDDHQHRDQVTRQPRRRGSPGTSSGRGDGVKLGTPVSSQPGVQFSGATAEGDPIQPRGNRRSNNGVWSLAGRGQERSWEGFQGKRIFSSERRKRSPDAVGETASGLAAANAWP